MNNSSSVILKTNANDQEVDQTLLKEIQSVGFFKLFRFADKLDIFLMIIGTLMAIVCGAAQPAFALLWGQMTNSFSSSTVDPDGMVNQAQQIMYNFFELGCGIFVASWLMLACWVITGERQAIKCRKLYLTKLLQQQIGWFDRTNQTELASKFATETFSFQGAIGEKIPTFVMSISMVISGLVIALIKGWKLALVILSYLPALTIAGVFYVNVLQNREKKIRQHYTAAGGKAQQTITAIKTVKSLNGQQYQQKKFNQNLQLASKKTIKFSIMAGVGMGGLIFTMFAAYALSFWYGSHLISENPSNYNVGTVLTIFFSIIMGGMNLSSISPCLKKFAQGQQAAARIYALIDRMPLMIRKQNGKKLDNLIGIIKFENVSFAYPKDPNKWILKNLNIQLKPNKTNALVGQSGCGKSTIMQLLMRFYDPQQGQITLDGIDLKQFDLGWLRQRIGYVGQQPVLFATTIKQNLLFGKSDSTDQQIDNALKKAEAYDFIYKDLPDRLQTYVGYGGGQLSGGQKQRIAIARAILKNPKILLLDEATSALDRKNQKLIQQTLDKITTGRTTITIAHRVKTIMNAEQIFVFNQGKIVQHGKFKELNRFKGLSIDLDQKLSQIALQELQIDNDGKIKQDIIKPTENIQKQNKKQEFNNEKYDDIFKRLFNYNLPDLPLFILGVFVALGHGTLSPIFSLFLAQMMEALIKIQLGQNQEVANFQSLIFLILAIAGFIAVTLQHSIFLVIGEKITKRLRLDTFKKIIRMPISWFDIPKNNSGSLSARLGTDCQLVNGLTSTLISTNIQVFSTLVTGLVIAFIHEWRISLITIALLPVMIGSGIMKMKFTMGFSSQTDEAYKDSSNLIMQAMSNIRTVTSFGVENTINKKYVQKLNQPMNLAMKKGNLSGFLFALSKLFMFFIFALIFYIGTLFVRDFKLAFVDVFTAIFAIMFSAITVGNNSQSMPDVGQSKNSAANIFQILDGEDEDQLQLKQNSKLLVLKQSKGQIQIKNITFKYPTRIKSVFQNFSMKIQAGHKVAFVGSSGCGKSTIIQMLMRFYQPSQGAIYLDGINIKDYDIHYLRSIFGLVSQEPVLFYATYKQNIKYNTEANYEQIVQATKKANALSFIEGDEEKQNNKTEQQQSKGFNKNVGVRGGHISGGQKQRVAIARTVLRNPKILLLDEATSALDSKNEKIVQQSLDNIMDGLTTISVAHRIQTIKNSNKIYVFDSGKIIQQGTYQYLKNKKGYFYRLQKGSSN